MNFRNGNRTGARSVIKHRENVKVTNKRKGRGGERVQVAARKKETKNNEKTEICMRRIASKAMTRERNRPSGPIRLKRREDELEERAKNSLCHTGEQQTGLPLQSVGSKSRNKHPKNGQSLRNEENTTQVTRRPKKLDAVLDKEDREDGVCKASRQIGDTRLK